MSEFSNDPVMPASEPVSFFQTWINALTKPNEQTYARMAVSPEANANKAYLWVFLASFVNFVIAMLVQGVIMQNMMNQFGGDFGDLGASLGGSVIAVICGAPISAAFSVLFFAITVAIVQWIAKMFGGQGNFNQLSYVFGAILAPFMLVSSVLTLFAAIPYVGFCFSGIALIAGIYILVLEVIAVKGVNHFGWGQALGSLFLPFVLIGFLCACLILFVVGGLMALGPTIGDVFSTINQSLGGY